MAHIMMVLTAYGAIIEKEWILEVFGKYWTTYKERMAYAISKIWEDLQDGRSWSGAACISGAALGTTEYRRKQAVVMETTWAAAIICLIDTEWTPGYLEFIRATYML